MKTLILLRHAKSSWARPGLSDFERPLNQRGRLAARAMGAEMRRLDLAFDRLLSSPAQRTKETVAEAAEGFGALPARFDERLYLAPFQTLLSIVRETDDACATLLLVGHNPGTEQLALLLSEDGAARDRMAEKYPTGALAQISLDVETWSEVGEGVGSLVRFIRPRDLDPALDPNRD